MDCRVKPDNDELQVGVKAELVLFVIAAQCGCLDARVRRGHDVGC